ncbi:tail fiber/spike domain-containing protein [Klebsiella quasipneumoniae]|uniref:tail fiber/spike domain-containing protein n=1 Tax=Klebsiella quasipneumoniae TaxID=1463165 RepID=UPI00388E8DFD
MALTLLATNNAESTLASAISATDTSLIVSAGTGAEFPDAVAGESYFKLTLTDAATGAQVEIVNVTARSGDIFTIERGAEGTTPRDWLANDLVANMMTAETINIVAESAQQATIAASQASESADIAESAADNAVTTLLSAVKQSITFQSGGELNSKLDRISDGTYLYYWTGLFPKVVPSESTVEGTGGETTGAWACDTSLPFRQDLDSDEEEMGAAIINGGKPKRPVLNLASGRTVKDMLYSGEARMKLHFGAYGDGIHDDTLAFEEWFECLMDTTYNRHSIQPGESPYMLQKGPLLTLESGLYVYSGVGLSIGGLDSYVLNIKGESALSTKILIANPDGFFIDSENNPVYSHMSDLTLHGGRGAVRYRNSASNPTSTHTFENMRLSGYSECGISANSIDMPYFRMEKVTFEGDPTEDATGACVSGLSAGGYVVGCIFINNKYGLKLSTATRNTTTNGPATPFNVEKCDFYRTGSRTIEVDGQIVQKPTFDVWIVPNPGTNNAGRGIVFSRNKFGSENLGPNDAHILIADQETASTNAGYGYNGDRHHSGAKSSKFVSGLTFRDNNVNSVHAANQVPFVLCNTPNFGNNRFDDLYDNGMPKYLIQFHTEITQGEVNNLTRSNVFNASSSMALQEGVEPQLLSNLNDVFRLDDPLYYFSGHPQSGYYPVGSQKIDFVSLFSGPTSGITVADATKSSVNNSYGGVFEATEITMGNADGRAFVIVANGVTGRKTWLDAELKRGNSNSVQSVKVEILNADGSMIWVRRIVLLDSVARWQKVTLPFIPSVSGTFIVKFSSKSYVDASATKFIIGNLNIYMNDEPINTGHNSGLGMNWSTQHVVNGTYHEWYDASGNKRAKNGAPTSVNDGVIISSNPAV